MNRDLEFLDRVDPALMKEGLALYEMLGLAQHQRLRGDVILALAIGAIAGLYPPVRAARLSPTEALRTA